ncbi:MAG TPA: DNA polymerase III subunit alpha [Tepidisphaeraceae bacterium]|nr:DNA polymerase III subunit alpha [Tepidisphaeraceae bacterium]
MSGFVHLHVHTDYSVLDGACKVYEIVDRCKEYGMRACAMTDHGNIFGAVAFYQAAKKAGIKPIIGCELYVAPKSRFDKTPKSQGDAYYHLVVLCKNVEGYHNLCRLSTIGYLEGHHYRPRVDDEVLAKYSGGLIAMSACLGGQIPHLLLYEDFEAAEKAVEKYIGIFGRENFMIELMDHGMPDERKVNPLLIQLADRHNLRLVATNDCHYLDKTDSEAHEALLCIQTQTNLQDEKRFKFPTTEFYFRSPEEMREVFADLPKAIANTEEVADMCDLDIPLDNHLVPKYKTPDGSPKSEYLRKQVQEGLKKLFGTPEQKYIDRAEFELGVIERMGFVDYFLVVWDLIHHARSVGIPVGPGRGSGAGSLVAYALRITNLDPIKYNLLFERFLNPERISMPDFDLDFCYRRREEMIEYVRVKYGDANVCQIITFGKMMARQAIRNVGRVMGMSYGDVDRIAKLIPEELNIKLKDAIEREPELKNAVDTDPDVGRLWKLATRLEGTIGSCGTHAAGVVICDEPLTDHVALFKASNSDVVATQLEMKSVEKVGLLKMDFLGLRTLTVIDDALKFIRQNRGVDIDMDHLPLNDEPTYELLRSGRTTGVFQLESSGMRDLSKRIGLESLEEICALVALFRPGPMQFIDQYIESKHNPEKIVYDHPLLEPILKETYGVALYQEQVMQIVQAIAGFSLGQADVLRRAMGKKDKNLMAEQASKFAESAKANGIDKKLSTLLFQKIEQFAGYGFNKSHSMAYALVAYQTAYLKANYPVEFMAALLTSESGSLEKVAEYVEECRRLGIAVLPPCVNKSYTMFNVEGDNIRFGMGAVKNVGVTPTEAIVAEREQNGPFEDIFKFCCRLDSRVINRRLLESLNKAGAFASTGWNRRQVEAVLDAAINEGQISQREREMGQTSLFDIMDATTTQETLHTKPNLAEWPENELLVFEKEMLGLYGSSHPLARHALTLRNFSTVSVADIPELRDGQEVVVGGLIVTAKQHVTARGNKMAFINLETLEGQVEITVFSDTYEQRAGLLVPDMIVMVPARVSFRNNNPGLVASDVLPIDEAERVLTRSVHIRLQAVSVSEPLLQQLARLLGAREGKCGVYLHCVTPEHKEVVIRATSSCEVNPSPTLRKEVEELLGEGTIWFGGGSGNGNGAKEN